MFIVVYTLHFKSVYTIGAAYARAEDEVSALVLSSNLPFLPTPMGKGLMADDHPLCVSAARSKCVAQLIIWLHITFGLLISGSGYVP